MKKIIISESMEQKLFQYLINEAIAEGEKRLEVVKYLDDNFKRADKTILNKDGEQESSKLVVWLDNTTKQPFKTLTLENLYFMVQKKFQNIFGDKKQRNQFIWDTVNAWYNNNYNKTTGNIRT